VISRRELEARFRVQSSGKLPLSQTRTAIGTLVRPPITTVTGAEEGASTESSAMAAKELPVDRDLPALTEMEEATGSPGGSFRPIAGRSRVPAR
jgi:hypothetical protein